MSKKPYNYATAWGVLVTIGDDKYTVEGVAFDGKTDSAEARVTKYETVSGYAPDESTTNRVREIAIAHVERERETSA